MQENGCAWDGKKKLGFAHCSKLASMRVSLPASRRSLTGRLGGSQGSIVKEQDHIL